MRSPSRPRSWNNSNPEYLVFFDIDEVGTVTDFLVGSTDFLVGDTANQARNKIYESPYMDIYGL